MDVLRHIFVILIIAILASVNDMCPTAPFSDINLTQVNGTWYAIQGIEHNELRRNRRPNNSNTCPVVNLTVTTDSTLIKFVFDRKNEIKPSIHNLMVNDTKTSSVWSIVPGDSKRPPFDLIQVTSLTEDAILLTMCSEKRKGSVVLSRNNKFDEKVAKKANATLIERQMPNKGTFNRCIQPVN